MANEDIPRYERETVTRPGERHEYSRTIVPEDRRGVSPAAVVALVLAAIAVTMALMLFFNQRRQDEMAATTQPTATPQPSQTVTIIPVPQVQTVPVPATPPTSTAPGVVPPAPTASPVIDDATIENKVRDKLLYSPELASAKIDVKVDSGWVTLSGEVTNPAMKSLAEQLAKQVKGVKRVTNNIDVKLP